MTQTTSNPVTRNGIGADSKNQAIVINRRALDSDILEKIAQHKGVQSINISELSPIDIDLITILYDGDERWTFGTKDNPTYEWGRANDASVKVQYLPKGTRFLLVYIECSDNYYDQEHLVVLDDDNTIYTA